MRKADASKGILLCLLLNLFLNGEWAVLAAILWGLHRWLGLPGFPVALALAIWLGIGIFATLVVCLVSGGEQRPALRRENRNPYSARTADLFGGKKGEKPED